MICIKNILKFKIIITLGISPVNIDYYFIIISVLHEKNEFYLTTFSIDFELKMFARIS